MQARGPLMKEHRLIEWMLSSIGDALAAIDSTHQVDPLLVDTTVDFIRVYADRTHHGKEEDILFAELSARELSPEDRRAMDELVAEHVFARKATSALAAANERYCSGEDSALTDIVSQLRALRLLSETHREGGPGVLPRGSGLLHERRRPGHARALLGLRPDDNPREARVRGRRVGEAVKVLSLRASGCRPTEVEMLKWQCRLCPYVYDPELGDPEAGVPPGTPFEELPDDWLCPDCEVGKEFFEPLE